jgi:hypothetical protein
MATLEPGHLLFIEFQALFSFNLETEHEDEALAIGNARGRGVFVGLRRLSRLLRPAARTRALVPASPSRLRSKHQSLSGQGWNPASLPWARLWTAPASPAADRLRAAAAAATSSTGGLSLKRPQEFSQSALRAGSSLDAIVPQAPVSE